MTSKATDLPNRIGIGIIIDCCSCATICVFLLINWIGMTPSSPFAWFVVITRWGQWKKISERLTALRIRHFIPSTYNTLVFFQTEKKRALDLVNAGEVKGRFIVDHGTRAILEVPEKQMEAFIRVVMEFPDTPVSSEFPITKGTRVRVVRGPLKGIEGEVEETPNGVQLVVGIQSLICARITIGRGDVVPVEDNETNNPTI